MSSSPAHTPPGVEYTTEFTGPEIERYSRQLLVPEIGVEGQKKITASSVLIVGAGGLGCPAGAYLVGAGVGRVGIVDYDGVEVGNLHRQILHSSSSVGVNKAESAAAFLSALNPLVTIEAHTVALTAANAAEIVAGYDVILDASDNVATRYLVNDAALMAGKTLVSASALRLEGQLTVYGYQDGPCYRCLFPTPPPPSSVTNCSDGGVLGVVPGILGTLQALEALKIVSGMGPSLSSKLLFFDAASMSFRTAKLRGRSPSCALCGDSPSITQLVDYEAFCGAAATDKDTPESFEARGPVLPDTARVSVADYAALLAQGVDHVCIDVRIALQHDICAFSHALSLPLSVLKTQDGIAALSQAAALDSDSPLPIYTLCRRGVASRKAVAHLASIGIPAINIDGGLTAWKADVDPSFPLY